MKQLADPRHLNHYIAYDVLKKAIHIVVAADQPDAQPATSVDIAVVNETFGKLSAALSTVCRPADSRFHELLQHELVKVNRFATLQFRTLLDSLREALRPLLGDGTSESSRLDVATLLAAERQLDDAAKALVALENYRRINFTGFRKIVKKFDKKSNSVGHGGGNLSSWFMPQLVRESFVVTPLDILVVSLSWGYAALRQHRRAAGVSVDGTRVSSTASHVTFGPSVAVKPHSTKTFWLVPSLRIQAICTLIKQFDLICPSFSAYAAAHQKWRFVQAVTSDGLGRVPCSLTAENSMVYFDSPDFVAYNQRLRFGEGSGPLTFRCRRTIQNGDDSAGVGELVERDGAASALGPHAFTPVAQVQVPDAFPCSFMCSMSNDAGIDRSDPSMLLEAAIAVSSRSQTQSYETESGSAQSFAMLTDEDAAELTKFANQFAEAVSSNPMSPVATVGSDRLFLRGSTDSTQGIRIALDSDVQFTQRFLTPTLAEQSDVIDFPYCLLEVSSDNQEISGSWLEELHSHAALRNVSGFSIGAHAVAVLHEDKVAELPDWYEHISSVGQSAPIELLGIVQERRRAYSEASEAENVGTKLSQEPVTAEKIPQHSSELQIEPKNLLAVERTMLEWMHTVVALGFLAVGLWTASLHGMPKQIAFGVINRGNTSSLLLGCFSLLLMAVAICFAWYAAFCHWRRATAMLQSHCTEHIFNSRLGPGVFVVVVGAALVAHAVLQVTQLWWSIGGVDDDTDLDG